MFEKVLVAVDDGVGSDDARLLASALAAPGAAPVTVHFTDGAGAEAVNADVILGGSFNASLGDLVTQREPDLLVIGAHHRARIWSTNHVRAALHHVACSLAIAPKDYAAADTGPIARIGVGYDEGVESEAALAAVRSLARQLGAEIEVIEIVRDSNLVSTESTVGLKAESATARLSGLEDVSVRVLEGDVRQRLREAAHAVDLLVLGEHRPDLPSRVLWNSTGGRLAQGLPCPLLLHHS